MTITTAPDLTNANANANANASPVAPESEDAKKKKKWARRIVIAGVLLATLCRFMPEDYQTPCQILANLCSGGLL